MPASNFSTLDGFIIVAYLACTVAIGIYVNRYIRGMSDFLVAGRALRTRLGIATMVGSELGLVTAMYSAQKGFTGGFAAFHIGVLAGLACLIVGFTGLIVVPLREMRVMTIPEFYEKRFGSRRLRIFGGLLLAISGILNMGMFLKAGAIFVTGLTGMIDPTSVKVAMTLMIVLVLAYTTLGGMISVILTDYIQFVVLSFGLLLACGLAIAKLGWTNIFNTIETVRGAEGFDPFLSSEFGGSYVAWMFFLGIVSCGVWQTAVMRACAAESVAVVRQLFIWSSIGFMIRFIIPQFLGICAVVYFWQDADLRSIFFAADGSVIDQNSMQAMPVFLSQLLPIGILGLVGAGMLAAFMSTHDTYLLCWASVLVEDVVNPAFSNRLSQKTRILLTRLLLAIIAGFLLVWSMWYELGQDLWDYMAVSGAIYFTGAFAVLIGGLYWKRTSSTGAWLALGSGIAAVLGLGPVQKAMGIQDWLSHHQISGADIGLATVAVALVSLVTGSLLMPDSARSPDQEESV